MKKKKPTKIETKIKILLVNGQNSIKKYEKIETHKKLIITNTTKINEKI